MECPMATIYMHLYICQACLAVFYYFPAEAALSSPTSAGTFPQRASLFQFPLSGKGQLLSQENKTGKESLGQETGKENPVMHWFHTRGSRPLDAVSQHGGLPTEASQEVEQAESWKEASSQKPSCMDLHFSLCFSLFCHLLIYSSIL